MDYEHLLVEVEDRVKVITMNRPEVLNAMNHKLDDELHHAVMSGNEDDGVGCIVITGAGNGLSQPAATSTSSECTPSS